MRPRRRATACRARECSSVSGAFKRVADDNPGLPEARYNQGAVLYECGRDRRGRARLGGPEVRAGDHQPRLHRLEEQRAGRAESLFQTAINDDPLHSVEARNNMAQILRDKARKASTQRGEEATSRRRVSNLRTVLALDSNNLQAFSTLAFIYYDMNMLEMAKLVGNQAIKKAEEIATGKFEEEKVEEAHDKAAGKAGKGKARRRRRRRRAATTRGGPKPKEIGREAGTASPPT
jgi:hypothetical protein